MINALVTAFSGPGAAFMYAITAVGAFSLTVGIERFWMLVIRWKVNAPRLFEALEGGAETDILNCVAHSPLHPMLAAGANDKDAETMLYQTCQRSNEKTNQTEEIKANT